jgi:tagatose-1,6-bisphosphate aldolase non-catalytic subunit AgaZ/GatZ
VIKKLKKFINKNSSTLLCVGPMSKNVITASIDLANNFRVPIGLIASRRQIDSEDFGGGYVENWTTKQFADYVKLNDKDNNIFLARDHGGPWQNTLEVKKKYSIEEAMISAKKSYKSDIDAGLNFLHIDPSIDIHKSLSKEKILERVFELMDYCWDYAQKQNKNISFEIGTEEQSKSNSSGTEEEVIFSLEEIKKFCKKNKISYPEFIVIQTGTKVMETKNIGTFDSDFRIPNQLMPEIQLPKILKLCKKYNIMMKEHNTDYLSTESLNWHPRLGIHAANVAPEFGVIETKSLLEFFKHNNCNEHIERFIEI